MWFKRKINEFIAVIRIGEEFIDDSDIEITEAEYNSILSAIQRKPSDTDEIIYRLDDTLNWVACEKEAPMPPEPTESDYATAGRILMGVEE